MPKARTTIKLDERVLRAVRVKAARSGRSHSDMIEALRRDLGLDLYDRIGQTAEFGGHNALCLAVEAQHNART